jgi:hypothetical protein
MSTSKNITKKKSASETGHKKNVANFSSLSQILQEMGAVYNPSNQNIQLVALNPINTALIATMKGIDQKKPIYTNAVADRENTIAPLAKKTTRILNSFKSLSVSATDKENVASMVKKIRGDKKPLKVNPDNAEVKAISTSQQSYDSRIANFDTLIELVASHSLYSPNEEELKIENLQSYHQTLSELNGKVNTAGNTIITARKQRNDMLYKGDNNAIQLVKDIKSYLKSLGEAGLPYYKAAVKLKFVEIV